MEAAVPAEVYRPKVLAVCVADFSPPLQQEIRALYAALPPDLQPVLVRLLSRVEAEASGLD
jgi:hypothetical protein